MSQYRSGADVYLGAQEARALMGRWRGGGGGGGGGGRGFRGGGPSVAYGGGYGGGDVTIEEPAGGDYWIRDRRRREWERLHPGIPFEGAEAVVGAWEKVCGAALAGDQTAIGAVREMLALGGGTSPTGVPGASAVAHGVYGDPHGAHRGWGHHHMGAEAPGGGSGIQPRAWLAPYPDPTLASRQGLPMNTGGVKVPYNSTAIITSRPQRVAFRPERIFVSPPIGGTAGLGSAGWFINDITIGNRSQLVQAGGLPGDMFQNTSIDSFVTFETAQTSMDVVISTTLIDSNFMENSGAVFYGGIIGTAAI
jgi:hypothetical protein